MATVCGLGRNSGLIQPALVTTNQSTTSAITVITLMVTLEPSPGSLKRLVRAAPTGVAAVVGVGSGMVGLPFVNA